MIKLTIPWMKGAAVRRVQELLQLAGYGNYMEVDGVYGPKTEAAVRQFQLRQALTVDGIVGSHTRSELRHVVDNLVADDVPPTDGIVDITKDHNPPRNARTRSRLLSSITSIVLHQTGCEMPRKPKGWGRVNAHYGITQEGVAIAINPLGMFIWHAQRLSPGSIGIEIEGNYPGVSGDTSTLWKPGGGPHVLGDRMIQAAARILHDIRKQVSIHHVYAHRQSTRNRRACPGQAIWEQIGIPMREKLGCSEHDLTQTFGERARQIPVQWDTSGTVRY